MATLQIDVLPAIPDGYITLADYVAGFGGDQSTARRAAGDGRIPGAVLYQSPGMPRPIWSVPADCAWRPLSVGWQRGRSRKKIGK